jgi:hypothetical protein
MGFGRAFSPLLMSEVKIKAHFVEPMLLRRTGRLPQGGSYELKIDGFRAEAIKSQWFGYYLLDNNAIYTPQ